MNVRYCGRKTVDDFGEPLHRALDPVAIVTFKEAEEPVALAILESTGYSYDVFGDFDEMYAMVVVDGHEDYRAFMREWKEGKKAYNL